MFISNDRRNTIGASPQEKAGRSEALIDVAEVRRAKTLLLPQGQVTEVRAFDATANGDQMR